MKLGLLADIHEDVERLSAALSCFRANDVQQVVVLGDVVSVGERLGETCQLLMDAGAIGVWGNHDYGLCVEPDEDLLESMDQRAMRFLSQLRPRLVVEDCYFTHVEPWLDPEALEDLWYFAGPPTDSSMLARIFTATPHRLMFAGHYHRWQLATPLRLGAWTGNEIIRLKQGRYFIVIGALFAGRFAILDTDTWDLRPYNLDA